MTFGRLIGPTSAGGGPGLTVGLSVPLQFPDGGLPLRFSGLTIGVAALTALVLLVLLVDWSRKRLRGGRADAPPTDIPPAPPGNERHPDGNGRAAHLGEVADGTRHDLEVLGDGPLGAYHRGLRLQERGDNVGAREAYLLAIDSGHPEAAPMAAINLGHLLAAVERDPEQSREAYQWAIESGHETFAAMAAVNLGHLLAWQGDQAGAQAAFVRAIESGHPLSAALGWLKLGILLAGQGDPVGARSALDRALASDEPEVAEVAAENLEELLEARGDPAAARAAFANAFDSPVGDGAVLYRG